MKSTQFEFVLRAHAKIGSKTALGLGAHLHTLRLSRIAVIVDKNVTASFYVAKVLQSLKKGFRSLKLWEYAIAGEPDYDSLDHVKSLFMKNGKPVVDSFVAIGGGSVIDFAKGLATLAVNPGPARRYRGFPTNLRPSLPVIALPTVAGTGSEVTYNASFIDWKEKRKMGINTFNNFPRLSILDPLLTLDCPKSVTISSAMDSLVHALESFATPKANVLSKIYSQEAFSAVYNALPKAAKNLNNEEARLGLLIGAYLAGIAIVQAGGGPASILSYPVGVHGKVPHGIAGAIFLPSVVQHNARKGFDYSALYDRLPNTDSSLSKKEKNDRFVDVILKLHEAMEIPTLFARYPLVKEHATHIRNEIGSLGEGFKTTSSVPFTTNDAKKIFNQIVTPNS